MQLCDCLINKNLIFKTCLQVLVQDSRQIRVSYAHVLHLRICAHHKTGIIKPLSLCGLSSLLDESSEKRRRFSLGKGLNLLWQISVNSYFLSIIFIFE